MVCLLFRPATEPLRSQVGMTNTQTLFPVIQFPIIQDSRGGLLALEGLRQIPFEMKRLYTIFGVGQDQVRGNHAHKELRQLAIMLCGSILLSMDNGTLQESVPLKGPNEGILIEPMVWHSISHFSKDAILLVVCSDVYKESDYYRNYADFKKACQL